MLWNINTNNKQKAKEKKQIINDCFTIIKKQKR